MMLMEKSIHVEKSLVSLPKSMEDSRTVAVHVVGSIVGGCWDLPGRGHLQCISVMVVVVWP